MKTDRKIALVALFAASGFAIAGTGTGKQSPAQSGKLGAPIEAQKEQTDTATRMTDTDEKDRPTHQLTEDEKLREEQERRAYSNPAQPGVDLKSREGTPR